MPSFIFVHCVSFTKCQCLPVRCLSQNKRHTQTTTKYVELIVVADNREVRSGHAASVSCRRVRGHMIDDPLHPHEGQIQYYPCCPVPPNVCLLTHPFHCPAAALSARHLTHKWDLFIMHTLNQRRKNKTFSHSAMRRISQSHFPLSLRDMNECRMTDTISEVITL